MGQFLAARTGPHELLATGTAMAGGKVMAPTVIAGVAAMRRERHDELVTDEVVAARRTATSLKKRLRGVEIAASQLWALLLSVIGLAETTVIRVHIPILRTVDDALDWILLQFPLPGGDGTGDGVQGHVDPSGHA